MITKLEELQEKVNFWLHWLASSYIGSTNTATSARVMAGSLTFTDYSQTTTETGTVGSLTTHETLDKAIERLGSLSSYNQTH